MFKMILQILGFGVFVVLVIAAVFAVASVGAIFVVPILAILIPVMIGYFIGRARKSK